MRKFFFLPIILCASLFTNAQWVQTNGPLGGGHIVSLMVIGDTVLAGTDEHGIFLSTNHGSSWSVVTYDFSRSWPGPFLRTDQFLFLGTGAGIFRSSDGGVTWEEANMGMPSYRSISALAVNGGKIIVGTSRGSYFISENYGDTWTGVSIGQPSPTSLIVCSNNLFAGTFGNGVLFSTDNGATWTEVNNGLTEHNVQTLAVSGTNIFAGTFYGGVFLSTDNGTSWKTVNVGLPDLVVDALTICGTSMYAATRGGIARSVNNGNSWTRLNNGLPEYVWVRTIAADESSVFAGLDGAGIYYSKNSWNYWKATGGLPCTNVTSMLVNGSAIFAGTFGNGLFKSSDNGNTWIKNGNVIPEWVRINALAVNGSTLYAGTSLSTYISGDNGNSWLEIPVAGFSSFAFSGTTIYAGASSGIFGVFMSSNNGSSWENITNGLPNRPVNAVAMNGTTIFAGTGGDGVFRSINNGSSWIPVNSGLNDLVITSLVVNGTTIFAGTSGGVFSSTNNGALWSKVSFGEIHSLAIYDSTIFASTGYGIDLSTDNGNTWTSLNEGLNRLVYSLAFSGTNIFAGTGGSGVFINSTFLTGIEQDLSDVPQISIYPIPGSNSITIDASGIKGNPNISIFNINGQELFSQKITNPLTTIDISSFPMGLYIARFGDESMIRSMKFVKE